MELKKLIKKLQKKVIEELDITEIIKQLEYFLPLGNDHKLMNFLIFNSKNFIDIIECINYAKPKHMLNLLHFIEKMVKTNPNIAKYISNNKSFLKQILKLMQDKVCLNFLYFLISYLSIIIIL
jgi:molybdenum cofactor biosynthesis enzyme MoaA